MAGGKIVANYSGRGIRDEVASERLHRSTSIRVPSGVRPRVIGVLCSNTQRHGQDRNIQNEQQLVRLRSTRTYIELVRRHRRHRRLLPGLHLSNVVGVLKNAACRSVAPSPEPEDEEDREADQNETRETADNTTGDGPGVRLLGARGGLSVARCSRSSTGSSVCRRGLRGRSVRARGRLGSARGGRC